MKKFNEDELAILEVIANSSQPITIKGKDVEGIEAIGELILSFNPNRCILFNMDNEIVTDKGLAMGTILITAKEEQVLLGTSIPVQIERVLGDHIQLRAHQLDNGERIFKVNFVKIPNDDAPHVVFGFDKTTALLVATNNRNIDDVKVTIKNKNNSDCHVDKFLVADLDALDEMIQYLNTLKNIKGKFFDVVKLESNDEKSIIIIDVKSLTEPVSEIGKRYIKGIFRDRFIKLMELTKDLNVHTLIIDREVNSLVETFGINLKVNIYINEVLDEMTN